MNVFIFTVRIFNFSNFVAHYTDDTGRPTPVSCDKRFRDFWGYVLISRQYHLMFLHLEHESTVDISILYGACFFESFGVSPFALLLGTGRPGNFI